MDRGKKRSTAPKERPSLRQLQEEADASDRHWAAVLPEREELARDVAQREEREAVDAAMRFHGERGVYPWDMPRDSIQEQQAAWLRAAGVDPDARDRELKERMERLIRERTRKSS